MGFHQCISRISPAKMGIDTHLHPFRNRPQIVPCASWTSPAAPVSAPWWAPPGATTCRSEEPGVEPGEGQGVSPVEVGNGWYPLVNLQKAMENGHLWWIFPLKMVIFHGTMLVHQRVICRVGWVEMVGWILFIVDEFS